MNVAWWRKRMKARNADDDTSSSYSSECGSKLTVSSSDASKMEEAISVGRALVKKGYATEKQFNFLLTQFKCLDFEDSSVSYDSVFYDTPNSLSEYDDYHYENNADCDGNRNNIEDEDSGDNADDSGDNVEDDNANCQVPVENVPFWEAKPVKLNELRDDYRSRFGTKCLLEKKKFCTIAHKSNEKCLQCQTKDELASSIGSMMNPGETLFVGVRRHFSRKIATKSSNCCYFCYGDYKKFCQQRNIPCPRMVEKGSWHQHRTMDENGFVTCPKLQKVVCDLCFATGPDAHTLKFCPLNYPEMDDGYDHNMN